MPQITIDKTTYEVESGLAHAFNQKLKEKEQLLEKYREDSMHGKKYKVGEEEKEYSDMDTLYKDMKSYYDGMVKKYKDECESYKMKKDSLESQNQVLEDRLSKLPQDTTEVQITPELIKERLELHKNALLMCDSLTEDECYGLSDRQLKEKVINLGDLSEKTDQSINDMYEVALRYSRNNNFNQEKTKTYHTDSTKTEENEDLTEYIEYVKSIENAWMTK